MPLPCSPLSSDEEHAATRTANAKREGSVIYTLRDFLLLLLGLLAAILIFVGLLSRNIPWSTNHPGLYKCLRVRGSIRISPDRCAMCRSAALTLMPRTGQTLVLHDCPTGPCHARDAYLPMMVTLTSTAHPPSLCPG